MITVSLRRAVTALVVTASLVAATPAPSYHALSLAQLKKVVATPGWAQAGLKVTTLSFRLRSFDCGTLHLPAGLSGQGEALKTTAKGFQQIFVEVDQVASKGVAKATVVAEGSSTCKGQTPVHLTGFPPGTVEYSEAPPQYNLGIYAEVAVGPAIISAAVRPANAFGKQSVPVLKHALRVAIDAYRKASVR
jgi:hypothetical protein